jgi:hypothetical protein
MHSDTYLHGPFNIATVNGCKTGDRISQVDWDLLSCQALRLSNPLSRFDMPSYLIHVDLGVHVMIHDPAHAAALCAMSSLDVDCLTHLQKVLGFDTSRLSPHALFMQPKGI